nr:hypothetical protein HmN_000151700 [Hymenolepis microstoma]
MKTKEGTESNETYLYSTKCEDSPLNAALNIRRFLVGGPASSGCNHLSSAPAANQNAETSAYDPTTANTSKVHFLELEQVPRSSSNDLLLLDQVRNMNNSMTLTNPSDGEFAQPRIRRESKGLAACTLREFLLLILCGILITLLLIVIFLYFASLRSEVCQTTECVETSFKILSAMNQSVDPCEDFYNYACGGWIERNHIPPGFNQWTVFSELGQTAEYFAKELLEKDIQPDDSRGLQLAKTYYSSCLNEHAVDALGLTPVKEKMAELYGGWRLLPEGTLGGRNDTTDPFVVGKYDLTEQLISTLKCGQSNDIFSFIIEKDPRSSSHYAITLNPGDVSMQPEYYLDTSDPKMETIVKLFRDFMRTYSKMLGVKDSDLPAMDAVFELETLMAQNMEPRARQSVETNVFNMNLTELQTFCSVIDWKRLFNGLFNDVDYNVTDAEVIIITDRQFLEKRCEIYAQYMASPEKIKVVHDTAVWKLLWNTEQFMSSAVRKAHEMYDQAMSGAKEQHQRWLQCLRTVEDFFGMTIARKFVAEHFDEKSKEVATRMIRKIKMAFKNSFYQVEWMDDMAKKSVDMMGESIGYPEDINNIEKENKPFFAVDYLSNETFFENTYKLYRSRTLVALRKLFDSSVITWDMAPHIVNAYYNPRENHIYFPAGILQKPFYDANFPLALNYGGIGVVVGHEIAHAFDRQGSKFDAKGNLRQWWSESTRVDFEKNSECLVRQYGNYTVLGKNIDGQLTLSENIADNGGIKAAYRAYLKLQEKEGSLRKLAGLNLTFNQLFFISFAQVWCKRQLPQAALHTVMVDVHAPDRYRVIGTLSNSQEFSEAFSCPKGSTMNPPNKCILW